jgi:hypothetical protein
MMADVSTSISQAGQPSIADDSVHQARIADRHLPHRLEDALQRRAASFRRRKRHVGQPPTECALDCGLHVLGGQARETMREFIDLTLARARHR